MCGQGGAARTCHPYNPHILLKPQPLVQEQPPPGPQRYLGTGAMEPRCACGTVCVCITHPPSPASVLSLPAVFWSPTDSPSRLVSLCLSPVCQSPADGHRAVQAWSLCLGEGQHCRHTSPRSSAHSCIEPESKPAVRGMAAHNHLHQHLIFTILSHCATHQAILGFFTCC